MRPDDTWVPDGVPKQFMPQHPKGLEARLARVEQLLGIGDTPIIEPPHPSETFKGLHDRGGGSYYWGGVAGGVSTTANEDFPAANGSIFVSPFYLATPRRIDRMAIHLKTAAAGNARLGVYDAGDPVTLYPGRRLYDFGEVSTNATGIRTVTVSPRATLPRGLMWLAVAFSNLPGFSVIDDQNRWQLLGTDGSMVSHVGWSKVHAYGPLSEAFPSGASRQEDVPFIGVRMVE